MIRIFCLITFVSLSVASFSQTTKTVKATSTKPTTTKPVTTSIFKDLRDSVSYTAGIHIVNKYRSQNIYNFNSAAVARAVNDLQTKKQQLISDNVANQCVVDYQNMLMSNPNAGAKPKAPGVVLNDLRDSASYASGMYLVTFFREFDITNFNSSSK
jgi:hypothetical protein